MMVRQTVCVNVKRRSEWEKQQHLPEPGNIQPTSLVGVA